MLDKHFVIDNYNFETLNIILFRDTLHKMTFRDTLHRMTFSGHLT